MVREHLVKSILNKNKRRDPWFLDDYTINPYSGCSFNCLFCYIRGSKYGENMEEKLSVKSNALTLLEKQLSLRAKRGQHGIIVLSSATDPYLQIEQETKLTRGILELSSSLMIFSRPAGIGMHFKKRWMNYVNGTISISVLSKFKAKCLPIEWVLTPSGDGGQYGSKSKTLEPGRKTPEPGRDILHERR